MDDNFYMTLAIEQAKKCKKSKDIPIGAVIVHNGKVIAKAFNQKEKAQICTKHSEIIAIEKASKKLKNFILDGATIYVTKEPCLMCMGAILSARISKVVYGAKDLRFGTEELAQVNKFNHKCEIKGGVLEEECVELLQDFFKTLRCKNGSNNKTKNS